MALRRKNLRSRIMRATPEERLFEYAKGLKNFRKNRRAVLVRMSVLSRVFNQQRFRRTAMDSFKPLMMEFEGILVELANGDILCGLNGASYANMDNIILKLRIMFRDDEVLKEIEDNGGEDIFVRWFEMEKDYEEFFALAKERYDAARLAEMEQELEDDDTGGDKVVTIDSFDDSSADQAEWDTISGDAPDDTPITSVKARANFSGLLQKSDAKEQAPARPKENNEAKGPAETNPNVKSSLLNRTEPEPADEKDLDPNRPGIRRKISYVAIDPPKRKVEIRRVSAIDLDKLVNAIRTADLTPMIAREQVKLVAQGNNKPTVVFADRYVPMKVMQETFLPNVDLTGDRWFMRHLREVVDTRTLTARLDFTDTTALARGFRVNIDTIKSKEFDLFEDLTKRLKRNQFILEFSFQDIVSNVAGFLEVLKEISDKGYRTCIGDMDPYTFTLLDRGIMKTDFEKVRWTKEFEETATQEWRDKFKAVVKQVGCERVILVAVQDAAALKAGHEYGISLFQGKHVSNLG